MIFQEPTTSLNPCFTIGFQLDRDAAAAPAGMDSKRGASGARSSCSNRSASRPRRTPAARPILHQLSGGMNQRVMIAMAIACNPRLLIADEPTTALDVDHPGADPRAADVDLQRERGMALVLITHNMGVVAETAQRIMVMYAGADHGGAARSTALFADAAASLHRGAARRAARAQREGERRLATIPGMVPGLHDRPKGCLFAPRCAYATDALPHGCSPALRGLGKDGQSALPLPARRSEARWRAIARAGRGQPRVGDVLVSDRRPIDGRARDLTAHLSRSGSGLFRARARAAGRWAASRSPWKPARRSPWSANPAAANRRSRAWSTLIETPTAGSSDARRPRCRQPARRRERSALRRTVQLVFQNPYGSLNPRKKVGAILEEPLADQHRRSSKPERAERGPRHAGEGRPAARACTAAIRTCSRAASASASRSPAR